jgi:hypothetical protein
MKMFRISSVLPFFFPTDCLKHYRYRREKKNKKLLFFFFKRKKIDSLFLPNRSSKKSELAEA